jgi:hypothetical protein
MQKNDDSAAQNNPVSANQSGARQSRVKAAIAASALVAVLVTFFAFLLLKPAKSDFCASEVLTNGRGMKVNLTTQTIKMDAQSKPVPLQELSNQSALMVDNLSRLCREKEKGNISGQEYSARFDSHHIHFK